MPAQFEAVKGPWSQTRDHDAHPAVGDAGFGLWAWFQGGKFCGSMVLRLRLLGLKVRLKGAAKKLFECSYSATFPRFLGNNTRRGGAVGECWRMSEAS